MADEKPQHEVRLPAFRIAQYPITNAQYAAFVAGRRLHGALAVLLDRGGVGVEGGTERAGDRTAASTTCPTTRWWT